jgi:hypothetical protein
MPAAKSRVAGPRRFFLTPSNPTLYLACTCSESVHDTPRRGVHAGVFESEMTIRNFNSRVRLSGVTEQPCLGLLKRTTNKRGLTP